MFGSCPGYGGRHQGEAVGLRRALTMMPSNRSLLNISRERIALPGSISPATKAGSTALNELPVVLIVEDEYPLQAIVEEALTDGGFESDILSSGEEALTLFKGKTKNHKAL